MYPDPITPKSFPEKLMDVDYDPFGLMPGDLPPHPRLLATPERITTANARARTVPWVRAARDLLIARAAEPDPLPDQLPAPEIDAELNARVIACAESNALAWLMTDNEGCRERALHALRLVARGCKRWPVVRGIQQIAAGGDLAESKLAAGIARACDMLAAAPVDASDDALFRDLLRSTCATFHGCPHRTCGNHNTWNLVRHLIVGAALNDRQAIHDALYGCFSGPKWRYGLIHQMRHDILSDGCHWERTPGYHLYTLMGLAEAADVLAQLGVDLWHARLPMLQQDDGEDLHRSYGPRVSRSIKHAFDATLYMPMAAGDFSNLSDNGLQNIRGTCIWGVLYNLAFDAWHDPRHAWLLRHMEHEYPDGERSHPGLPMPLQTARGHLDFIRIAHQDLPAGRFSLNEDSTVGLTGRQEYGATLFPVHGTGVLRARPAGRAPAAFLSWSPHSAGHQAPAALHLDVHSGRDRLTDAPRGRYPDENYLTWIRTTIAHNTVTVDGRSMFPYDFDTESIWEADRWRDRISDGELLLWQPGKECHLVRAINENVYEGVRLDRTVLLRGDLLLDLYRVISEDEHQYDWAVHCTGRLPAPCPVSPVALGEARGYRHLADPVQLDWHGEPFSVTGEHGRSAAHLHLAPPPDARLILAADPPPNMSHHLGGLAEATPDRTALIIRTQATKAVFAAAWSFSETPLTALKAQGTPDADITVDITIADRSRSYHFPFKL